MDKFTKKYEKMIVIALIFMMMFVITIETIQLGWLIIEDLISPPMMFLTVADLLEIFGFFLLVLIGLELLETIKAYLVENVIHVEIVLEVALIALARKAIILDIEKHEGLTLIGTAGLILALSVAFYCIKRWVSSPLSVEKEKI